MFNKCEFLEEGVKNHDIESSTTCVKPKPRTIN